MVYIAFNPQKLKNLCKKLLIFYLTSFVFGGAAFALIYIVKPQEHNNEKWTIFRNISIKNSNVGSNNRVCNNNYAAFKIVKSKITKKDMIMRYRNKNK